MQSPTWSPASLSHLATSRRRWPASSSPSPRRMPMAGPCGHNPRLSPEHPVLYLFWVLVARRRRTWCVFLEKRKTQKQGESNQCTSWLCTCPAVLGTQPWWPRKAHTRGDRAVLGLGVFSLRGHYPCPCESSGHPTSPGSRSPSLAQVWGPGQSRMSTSCGRPAHVASPHHFRHQEEHPKSQVPSGHNQIPA